jgi:transcriptional regulator with XRE-family HTH domain
MSVNKKRINLSVTEKLRHVDTFDKLNLRRLSQREAAAKLGLQQSTLSKLLKSSDTLNANTTRENRKRKREGSCDAADEAPLVWFKQASSHNASINRSILFQQASDFGEKSEDFKATDGWLTRWTGRHGIVYEKINGKETRIRWFGS